MYLSDVPRLKRNVTQISPLWISKNLIWKMRNGSPDYIFITIHGRHQDGTIQLDIAINELAKLQIAVDNSVEQSSNQMILPRSWSTGRIPHEKFGN